MKTNTFLWIALVITTSFIIWTSCGPKLSIHEKFPNTISYESARELEEKYKDSRLELINNSLDIQDNRHILFSLHDLRKYLQYVERKAKRLGYSNLGIRVYLGVYPENSNYPDPGRTTVYFVPAGVKQPNRASLFNTAWLRTVSADTTAVDIIELEPYNYGHGGNGNN